MRLGTALTLVAPLVSRLYRAYFATLRIRGTLPDGSVIRPSEYTAEAEIIALCERDALVLAGFAAGRGGIVLVARGRDGDWASSALEALGCRVVRGAAQRRGLEALLALLNELRVCSAPLALVVDGPLGPAGRAKGGAVFCALRSGRRLRAMGVAARRAIVFKKTWSRIYLPLPFTNVAIVAEDVTIPPLGQEADAAALTRDLTTRLRRTRRKARQAVHTPRRNGESWFPLQ